MFCKIVFLVYNQQVINTSILDKFIIKYRINARVGTQADEKCLSFSSGSEQSEEIA